ncbi:TorF family putative porin [Rhizorhapis sp.]|uniref:TorF family putative porin n=1 Tax=Rhizorhapis sp. TaxID=1968842 RepID=UPI002B48A232|nr:TorF family putative porin [Rhizorhapis sp.]HKR17398.1 TorF family putative porin [Rhizorhapis sp.]
MRKSILGLSAVLFATVATPALAQDEDASGITVSGGAAVVTDYRFRGISQTDKDFAIQGTLSVAHDSGLYATVWGSTIDDYVAAGSDTELDLILGYKKSFGATTVDVGVLYYYYPGAEKFFDEYPSDFFEPFVAVSHTFGPVTGKLTAAYAPKQNALSLGAGREDNLYVAGDLNAAIPNTPISLSAHLGHNFEESFITAGEEYTDWSLGATYTYKNLSFGVSYVDTDEDFISPSGRNVSKAGVVGSVSVAF